jgi:putative nucleotidyltransferase with HDIG domain
MNHSALDKTTASKRITKWGLLILLLGLSILAAMVVIPQITLQTVDFSTPVNGLYVNNIIPRLTTFNHWASAWSLIELLRGLAMVALGGLLIKLYLSEGQPYIVERPRYLGIVFLLLMFFVGLVWLIVPQSRFLYLLPTATLSIMLTVLVGPYFSMLMTLLMGLTIGYMAHNSLELAVYVIIGGLMGALSLKGQMAHINRLLRAGIYVALANISVVLVFHFSTQDVASDMIGLMVIGVVNGILAASLTLTGFFLLGNLLGVTTSLRLLDLAQVIHPLLEDLLKRAPGTYGHTLKVSHLAEQAAERIGANALLTRVGSYYHDIGKMAQPYYFVENQLDGYNGHDELSPRESAQIIIDHVAEGVKLAKKHRLPNEVQAFITEHHGTTLVKYFYHQACEQTDGPAEVDEAKFRYPGPKPQRKETAIVMLADSCESAAQAKEPATPEEFDELVRQIINDKMDDGQLNDCDLTIHELDLIRQTFVDIFQGTLHHRIEYPAETTDKDTRHNTAWFLDEKTDSQEKSSVETNTPQEKDDH